MITIFCEIRLLKLPSPSEPGAGWCRICTALLKTDFNKVIIKMVVYEYLRRICRTHSISYCCYLCFHPNVHKRCHPGSTNNLLPEQRSVDSVLWRAPVHRPIRNRPTAHICTALAVVSQCYGHC